MFGYDLKGGDIGQQSRPLHPPHMEAKNTKTTGKQVHGNENSVEQYLFLGKRNSQECFIFLTMVEYINDSPRTQS